MPKDQGQRAQYATKLAIQEAKFTVHDMGSFSHKQIEVLKRMLDCIEIAILKSTQTK